MNTLTKERMTEIITDFVKNCESKQVKLWHKVHRFDESFCEGK